jgi:hypothetical protein
MPVSTHPKKMFATTSALFFAVLCFASSGAEFFSDGTITTGPIRLWEAKRSRDINFTLPGDRTVKSKFLFKLPENLWLAPGKFKNTADKIDRENKLAEFKSEYQTETGAVLKYFRTVKLLPDGKIRVKYQYDASGKIYSVLILTIPKDLVEKSASVVIDGTRCGADDIKNGAKTILKNIEFILPGPANGFVISPERAAKCEMSKKADKDCYLISITPKDGVLECVIAPGAQSPAETGVLSSKDTYYGVNFWDCNRMRLPDYGLCRNLIQNPSFEGGLRYYRYNGHSSEKSEKAHEFFYSVDPSEAKFGGRSLLMRALKAVSPQYIGPFIIPVEPGQKYTFSFYAKGSHDKGLSVNLSSFTASQRISPQWLGPRLFELSKEWGRYHTAFISPNSGICLFMRGETAADAPFDEGKIWIDGLQLEKGDLTEYAEKPLCAELRTEARGNFLERGKPFGASLKISSGPNIGGKVKIEITDFFGRQIWREEFPFKTGPGGAVEVGLPLDGLLSDGVFLVRADFTLDSGFKDTDYFRLNVMGFLKGAHKHHNFISLSFGGGEPDLARLLERYLAIGAGSHSWNSGDESLIKIAAEHGLEHWGNDLLHREPLTCGGEKITGGDIAGLKSPVPEEWLQKIERACCEKAKSNPWCKRWWFRGEPDGGKKFNEELKAEDMVKIYMAAYNGIKLANPENEFISPGPWNIRIAYGLRWIDDFMAAGAKDIPFAAVDGHAYQSLPEDPDLDEGLKTFINILNKHGMKNTPIISTEGIYHPPMNIPQWGSYTYNGAAASDSYWGKAPSYHLGLGEKMQSAFHARHFIIALKYADRIKSYDAHGSFRRFMDVDLTPYALCKTINTIGQLLGNADFKKDIRVSPDIRCYVFEDNLKRPVAAMWSHIKEADKNLGPYPKVSIPFQEPLPAVYDLMEAPVEMKKDTNGSLRVQATSFPTFFRGAPNTLDAFRKALENARAEGDNSASVKILAALKTPETLRVTVSGASGGKTKGKLTLFCREKKVFDGAVSLENAKTEVIDAPLDPPVSTSAVSEISVRTVFKPENAPEEKAAFPFKTLAVRKANEKTGGHSGTPDWESIPAIPLTKKTVVPPKGNTALKFPNGQPRGGDEDLSGYFKVAWDERNLYLLVKVTDDTLAGDGRANGRQNDSLQVFIDTLANAAQNGSKGFDSDDYVYNFFPDSKSLTVTTQRELAPERQLCGGLQCRSIEPEIKTRLKKTKDGYIYEIAFPRQYIAPIRLEPNTVFGFNMVVNDSDGDDVKQQLMLKETEGFNQPDTYPLLILKD